MKAFIVLTFAALAAAQVQVQGQFPGAQVQVQGQLPGRPQPQPPQWQQPQQPQQPQWPQQPQPQPPRQPWPQQPRAPLPPRQCETWNACPAVNGPVPTFLPGPTATTYWVCESGTRCPMVCPPGTVWWQNAPNDNLPSPGTCAFQSQIPAGGLQRPGLPIRPFDSENAPFAEDVADE